MPIASSARRCRTSWTSQPNAGTPKRWKSSTRPGSSRCGACSPRRSRPRRGGRRGARAGTSILRRRVECTRCTSGARSPSFTSSAVFDGAQPQPVERAGGRGHVDAARCRRRRVVDVERQLVVGAELGVEVGEAGHVELGQLGGRRSGPTRLRRQPSPGHGVVDQHHLAVGAQAGVGLQAAGPELERAGGRRRGCSRVRRRWRPGGRT